MRIDSLILRCAAYAIAAGCALVSFAASAGSQIHRCSDGERITYTDQGCSAADEGVRVVASTQMSTPDRVLAEPVLSSHATSAALGMSPRKVYETLGRPLQTIATLEGKTLVEYWVYRGNDGTTRVAFQEGRVTRIHAR